MQKHHQVAQLVTQAYQNSNQEFGKWMLQNHVPVVAEHAEKLSQRFGAHADLAVAGAWLHDFGDAFVHRHAEEHDQITDQEAVKVLEASGYSQQEIQSVMDDVIAPHSCKAGNLPATLEGKILATADAVTHLTTDFYLQFAWKHLPERKTYPEFLAWVKEKINRDFTTKIFFEEVREEVRIQFEALWEVFVK